MADPPKLVLTYLNIKGLAEPVRLALHIGGIAFDDVRVTYEQVAAMRAKDAGVDEGTKGSPTIPTGQVPTLTVAGEAFSQSEALLRWVGRRAGLYPDGLLQLRVDMVEETLKAGRARIMISLNLFLILQSLGYSKPSTLNPKP
jgi:glutathione S-transferase